MLRRSLYLVLAVLMLQLSWSTVAAYCGHETGRAAQHFGHHAADTDENARVADNDGKSADPAEKASLHSHCSSCAHTTLGLDALPAVIALAAPDSLGPPAAPFQYASSWSARPERPQWIAAV